MQVVVLSDTLEIAIMEERQIHTDQTVISTEPIR